ncbi:MAG: hypothetical protein J3K34DRAFT_27249 [Monoraphidium minutum]|nr:MAG: hypothetical protein J3K34DRAFT_27249 [Monoraphidium minutum]
MEGLRGSLWGAWLLLVALLPAARALAGQEPLFRQRFPSPWTSGVAAAARRGGSSGAQSAEVLGAGGAGAAAPGAPHPAARRLLEHAPTVYTPDAAPTACPGPVAPGASLQMSGTCTIRELPKTLPRPGAEITGVPEGNTAMAVVIVDDDVTHPMDMAIEPGATLTVRRLLYSSAAVEVPRDLAHMLAPHFVVLRPGAALLLIDSGKMLTHDAAEAAALFRTILGAPALQRQLQDWTYVLYTDNRSWLHVNWYADSGVMARGVGVINVAAPLDPLGQAAPNFALEATNETIVQILLKHATLDTPEPFLVYPQTNVTLWPRADWPAGGLAIMRPLFFIGWSDIVTAFDLGSCAGCASLTGRWSNVTFDSIALENLGYGHPAQRNATGYSVVSAAELWFFNMSRLEPRVSLCNSTLVVPTWQEVEADRYWSGVFNSPAKSQWLRDGLNITNWEVRSRAGPGAGRGRKRARGRPRDAWRAAACARGAAQRRQGAVAFVSPGRRRMAV